MAADLDAQALGQWLSANCHPAVAEAAMREAFGPVLAPLVFHPDPRISRQAAELSLSLGITTTLN